MMKKKKEKTQYKMVPCNIPVDMFERLNDLAAESDIKRSALIRQSIGQFLDDGVVGSLMAANIIELTQKLQEVRADLKEKDYKDMEDLIGNITKLKAGGN